MAVADLDEAVLASRRVEEKARVGERVRRRIPRQVKWDPLAPHSPPRMVNARTMGQIFIAAGSLDPALRVEEIWRLGWLLGIRFGFEKCRAEGQVQPPPRLTLPLDCAIMVGG